MSDNPIPVYSEINDFLASIPSPYRTENPLLYCLRVQPGDVQMHNYKPPFRKNFYFLGLVTNAGQTNITYDTNEATSLDSFLVFQAPGLIYSFYRDPAAQGYLLYFKKECFDFFRPELEQEFPFFNLMHTHFFRLNQQKFKEFAPEFEEVFQVYERCVAGSYQQATARLLALLYRLRAFTQAARQWEEGFSSPQQVLLQRYQQLINTFYLEKRTVEEYANLLNITPNHLSQSVKQASGKNALSFISERLLAEAKSLIRFTSFGMAEIAWRLNFSDPANFGKFFKKMTGKTPLQFREENLPAHPRNTP